MESLTWFLTFVVLTVWAVVGMELVRRPPTIPREWGRSRLRAFWGVAWILALLGGLWGPRLWSHTTSEHARDVAAGLPAELSSTVIRTPFAVQHSKTERNAAGQTLRTERELRFQLPVILLLFLGGVFYLRIRERRKVSGLAASVSRAAVLILLPLVASCGGDVDGEQAPRPDRRVVDVSWDTLALIEVAPEDTLLFSVNDMAASERGLWILDRVGHRIAHFDWDGVLQWYAGRAGSGPGELLNPRVMDLDSLDRAWVLDMGNNRIIGFDPDGRIIEEVSLRNTDAVLHTFAVGASGERFFGMIMTDGLQPVAIDRSGRAERGRRMRIRDAGGASGIAFQGYARGVRRGAGWVYAFTTGDGFFRLDGTDVMGERVRYPEWIPFPGMVVREEDRGDHVATTRGMSAPNFSAGDVAVTEDRVVIRFRGESHDAGLLLDTYELSGEYVRSWRLPRSGRTTAWNDRVVVAWNDPAPRILILRAAR